MTLEQLHHLKFAVIIKHLATVFHGAVAAAGDMEGEARESGGNTVTNSATLVPSSSSAAAAAVAAGEDHSSLHNSKVPSVADVADAMEKVEVLSVSFSKWCERFLNSQLSTQPDTFSQVKS